MAPLDDSPIRDMTRIGDLGDIGGNQPYPEIRKRQQGIDGLRGKVQAILARMNSPRATDLVEVLGERLSHQGQVNRVSALHSDCSRARSSSQSELFGFMAINRPSSVKI